MVDWLFTDMLALGPIVVLLLGALLIAMLSVRVRQSLLGRGAQVCCAITLGWLAAAQQIGATAAVPWLAAGGRTLDVEVASSGSLLLGSLLLVCGVVTAGAIAAGLGNTRHAYGMIHCGLLVLLAGGLLAISGLPPAASLLGIGLSWLGGTIMQQAGSEHPRWFRGAGLAVVALATALLALGAAPQLAGQPIAAAPWLAGCCVLLALGPAWGTTPAAPLLVRAPSIVLGPPALGGVLLGVATTQALGEALSLALLLFGVAATLLGAWNALTATHMSAAFAWQTTAQLGLLAIVFGTGRPEAGPMASGLLAHALVAGTAAALVVGLLERAGGSDALASLPPLPRPMLRAGLAYGLAAASMVGLPPLLGFNLRQVVLVLARLSLSWLAPVLLAGATLLALSYLPALAACFRRPTIAVPAGRAQRGAGWPLLLMLGLLAGGLLPQTLWQRALGDPGAAQAGLPPLGSLLAGWAPTLLLALLVLMVVRLNRGHPGTYFAGGEAPDEETGWALPFTALRDAVKPPAAERFAGLPQRAGTFLPRLRAWERRRYLHVAVAGLLVLIVLALQW